MSKTREEERKDYIDSRIASFETTQTVLLDGVAKQIPWKNKVGEDIFTLINRVNALPQLLNTIENTHNDYLHQHTAK